DPEYLIHRRSFGPDRVGGRRLQVSPAHLVYHKKAIDAERTALKSTVNLRRQSHRLNRTITKEMFQYRCRRSEGGCRRTQVSFQETRRARAELDLVFAMRERVTLVVLDHVLDGNAAAPHGLDDQVGLGAGHARIIGAGIHEQWIHDAPDVAQGRD